MVPPQRAHIHHLLPHAAATNLDLDVAVHQDEKLLTDLALLQHQVAWEENPPHSDGIQHPHCVLREVLEEPDPLLHSAREDVIGALMLLSDGLESLALCLEVLAVEQGLGVRELDLADGARRFCHEGLLPSLHEAQKDHLPHAAGLARAAILHPGLRAVALHLHIVDGEPDAASQEDKHGLALRALPDDRGLGIEPKLGGQTRNLLHEGLAAILEDRQPHKTQHQIGAVLHLRGGGAGRRWAEELLLDGEELLSCRLLLVHQQLDAPKVRLSLPRRRSTHVGTAGRRQHDGALAGDSLHCTVPGARAGCAMVCPGSFLILA
mmetsp:Transcript_143279/g.457794  ORF Transcript_143279/g.457794 Transcript_143279/m.457794 type:complete len:321 (+) Transcript_143279:2508-3470(+)